NLISGNEQEGVSLSGASNTLIQRNDIGVDANQSADLGNTRNGILVSGGAGNRILANLISGNNQDGVKLSNNTSSNVIQNNGIGIQGDNTSPLGNGGHGIAITGSDNRIGGIDLGQANDIAFNGGDGIAVLSGQANAIRGNSIFDNAGLGIDLKNDGVTANDTGDGDGSFDANHLQNFPVITSVTSGRSVTIQGTLNSTADTTFQLDFFASPGCDPSGNGEGRTYLGSDAVTTDGNGDATFSFGADVAQDQMFTATATDPDGNTSEFSACFPRAGEATSTPTPTATPTASATPTSTITPSPTTTPTPIGEPSPTPTPPPLEECLPDQDTVRSFQLSWLTRRSKIAAQGSDPLYMAHPPGQANPALDLLSPLNGSRQETFVPARSALDPTGTNNDICTLTYNPTTHELFVPSAPPVRPAVVDVTNAATGAFIRAVTPDRSAQGPIKGLAYDLVRDELYVAVPPDPNLQNPNLIDVVDAQTGNRIRQLDPTRTSRGIIPSLAFDPVQRRLFIPSPPDKTGGSPGIDVVDSATGDRLSFIPLDAVTVAVEYDPAANHLYAGSPPGQQPEDVRVIDVATGQVVHTISNPERTASGRIYAITLAVDTAAPAPAFSLYLPDIHH
ncbi:MAG: right-handed parallel beta-helix repeat-containing protein, partial [Chloroflexi bacterium]|nr:right-handed parallel beta-helix repeat-containing protein [Chloroflexota bacterium]